MQKNYRKSIIRIFVLGALLSFGVTAQVLAAAIGVVNFGYVEQQHKDFVKSKATYEQTIVKYRKDFDAKYAKSSEKVKTKAINDYNEQLKRDKANIFSKVNKDVLSAVHSVVVSKGLVGAAVAGYVVEGETVDITKEVANKLKGQ